MYPRFSCLLFGNPCVSPSSVTILNHVWFTIAPLSPFPSPRAPTARVTRRRLGTSQVVFSLPASRVDFDVLEDDCMTQPHFLQSSLKKAKEYFEATCSKHEILPRNTATRLLWIRTLGKLCNDGDMLRKRHPKKRIRATSNFISLIPLRSMRQMLTIFSGVEF